MRGAVAWILTCLLLGGCATMNLQECQALNPAKLGFSDGQQGYGLWRLDKHIESCARFGISFDRQAYLNARDQGLLLYCTPENGDRVGFRGETYENVCPPALEPAFLSSYRRALYLNQQNNFHTLFWLPAPWRH